MGNEKQVLCSSIASFVDKWEADKADRKKPSAYGYLKAEIISIKEKDIKSNKDGTEYHIHEYTLKDGTTAENGQNEVMLGRFMDKDEDETFELGEIIEATDIMVKNEFKGQLQLTTTKKTKLTKAKPGSTITKAGGSSAKGSGKPTGGSGTGAGLGTTTQVDVSSIVQAVNNAGDKVVVAIQEMQATFLDQLKEVIKGISAPPSNDGQEDEAPPGEEDQQDEQSS